MVKVKQLLLARLTAIDEILEEVYGMETEIIDEDNKNDIARIRNELHAIASQVDDYQPGTR